MSGNSFQQIRILLGKNWKIAWRSKTMLKEQINILLMLGVVLALSKSGNSDSSQYIPVYMSIAIMMFCRGVALNWVAQKQTKQAEVQKIMGTKTPSFIASWIIFFIINGIIISVQYIGLLEVTGVFAKSNISFGTILGLYALYMLASFSFVLFLASFFEEALLASQVITFVQLLGSMLYYLLLVKKFRQSLFGMQVTALLPSVCFQYTIMTLGFSGKPLF